MLNVLTVLFVVLKLAGVINWSWFLVLLPSFISIAIIIGVFFIALLAAMLR